MKKTNGEIEAKIFGDHSMLDITTCAFIDKKMLIPNRIISGHYHGHDMREVPRLMLSSHLEIKA